MLVEKLFEIQSVILNDLKGVYYYPRDILSKVSFDNYATGIVGQRGTGKTTFLQRQALAHNALSGEALYTSADNLYFLDNKLIDLVDSLYKETRVRLLCLDEIHKYPNWEQELKNISDTYRNFKVLFSGSSMTDIVRGKFDLSRRVTLHHLPGLSFREFLQFYHQKEFPTIELDELLSDPVAINNQISFKEALLYFKEYLSVGYYPFFHRFSDDVEKYNAVINSAQTTIFEDIAVHHKLKTPTLMVMENLFKYVLQSNPGELNINKLANALNKDHENVKTYLYYLEQAGLLNFLFTDKKGKAFLKNPIKIYPENTNLHYAYYYSVINETMIGKIREAYVVNQLKNAGYVPYYTKQGDLKVDQYTFEIGGKNKSDTQIKSVDKAYILADGITSATFKRIPLYYVGFLY